MDREAVSICDAESMYVLTHEAEYRSMHRHPMSTRLLRRLQTEREYYWIVVTKRLGRGGDPTDAFATPSVPPSNITLPILRQQQV